MRIRAGYTFLGQFIDHDLTLDATSSLEKQIDLAATTISALPRSSSIRSMGAAPTPIPRSMSSTPGNDGHAAGRAT